jgi:NNP family nitrate/nitrite transporter-like MFS transporter
MDNFTGQNPATKSNYRWYVLILTMLTFFSISGLARMCIPVLFTEMAADLNMNVVGIGAIWGLDPLAGMLIGLPAGLFIDRFGIKRTLTLVCILAAIFGALRGFSFNFTSMAVTTFLFGIFSAMIPGLAPKVTAVWFRDKHLGLANALQNLVWHIGSMAGTMFSATILSPLLGGWRNVIFIYGIPSAVVGLLWLFTGREPAHQEMPDKPANIVPFREALSHVIRLKGVWIIGLVMLAHWGAGTAVNGYLSFYLKDIGWTPASADTAITLVFAVNCAGVVPMTILSDRVRSRKLILGLSIASTAIGAGLVPALQGSWVLLLIGITGFLKAAASTILIVMTVEMKEVGGQYAGTAVGLVSTIGMLGAFLAPPIGNSLALINVGLPFVLWGCLAAMGLPLIFFIKDQRNNYRINKVTARH